MRSKGGLAAAGRPDDADEFAGRDLQADVVDRDNAIILGAELLAQVDDVNRRAATLYHLIPTLLRTPQRPAMTNERIHHDV